LFANNAVHNANNAIDQQIFALNARIQVNIFLIKLEFVQIVVQQDNTLIKALVVALIVIQLVKFVKELINAQHAKIIYCSTMAHVDQIVHLI
jgi:hypothetical protein